MSEGQKKHGLLSVVIPAYNEQEMIAKAAEAISGVLREAGISHELIFVDDGSKDLTWEEIRGASERFRDGADSGDGNVCADRRADGDDRYLATVRGVSFSRNFGKESAIFAGLSEAKGDCCAVIDCDLQHPPETLIQMYRLWQEGYQVIEGVKKDRGKESRFYGFCAKWFYRLMGQATKMDMSRASDFKLLDRKAVDALLRLKEKNAFFRALSSWIGFKTTQVEFEVRERQAGTSKWSFGGLISYAFSNLTSFSAAPMQLVTVLGVIVLICSILLGMQSLYKKFTGQALEGFTTVIIIILIIGSILMICLGIIGYYIAQIYEEIKGRPRYIVADRCEREEKKKDS